MRANVFDLERPSYFPMSYGVAICVTDFTSIPHVWTVFATHKFRR